MLPTPEHFEQAVELLTLEMVEKSVPCGPDPQPYVEAIRQYADAGFDDLYIQQIGPNRDEFFAFFVKEVEPLLA